MKKIIIVISAMLLLANVSFAKTTLVVAGSEATGSLLDMMSVKLKEFIEADSNGDLKVNLIRGQVLGNANQVLEQHSAGSVDIMFSRPDHFSAYINDFQVLSWGFTFRDREHMTKFLKSPVFREMADKLRKKIGVRILAAAVDQPRVMYSRRPIRSIDDIDGLKIRVPQIKSYLRLWETLGTKPTQVAWSEAFISLKTGVVDAAEADANGAYSQKFHIAVPYIILTDHVLSSAEISINEKKYQSLSTKEKKAVKSAAEKALAWMSKEALSSSQATFAKMKKEGATILSINSEPFSEKAVAGVELMESENLWSKGLWRRIRNIR